MTHAQNIGAASIVRDGSHEADAKSPLVRKLENLVRLSREDRAALDQLSAGARLIEPHTDLMRVGERPADAVVVLDGFACRYKHRVTGERQILALLLPGDVCDVDAPHLGRMDHAVGTLSACLVARISRDALAAIVARHPTVARALRLAKLAEEATAREWLINLGARSATERMAHLFCELLTRLEAVGLARENGCKLPITQLDLADTLGLSSVHVNRTLQELRRKGLIELRGRSLKLRDLPDVRALAEFNPAYLRPAH
jgi:CRP-like cAMP-binding protein